MIERDYEIFDGLPEGILSSKFKLRQIILYHVENTDNWIMIKRGALGNSVKDLVKIKINSGIPAPKTFKYKLYGYHIGQPYEVDDDGRILGEWPVIGNIDVKTDKVKIVTGDVIQDYSLFRIPIPF